ncbi:ADP-ribosylglycohydrolase [Hexamita inflata]|uniref:ADP-ribosylhydrolase ARH3 n=1 Tax=Hexamita inflata TaxID=28002 RepID=A0AA86TPI5_9EUKA|nr:ADP-ribosylglycohydrolase [Hexamita inflata]
MNPIQFKNSLKGELAELRIKQQSGKQNISMRDLSIVSGDKQLMKEAKNLKSTIAERKFGLLDDTMKRQLGAYFGTLIGDALGAPFEFFGVNINGRVIPDKQLQFPSDVKDYEKSYDSKNIMVNSECTNTHFNFNCSCLAGMWSDDSSQMIALAEVLIAYKKVNAQLMFAIEDWYEHGFGIAYNSQLNHLVKKLNHGDDKGSFDIGNTTVESLRKLSSLNIKRDSTSTYATQSGTPTSNGNGALMRNSATFFIKDLQQAVQQAYEHAKMTHRGEISALCCSFHTFTGWCLINNQHLKNGWPKTEQFILEMEKANIPLTNEEFNIIINSQGISNWRSPDFKFSEEKINGYLGGYVADCLVIALNYVYHGKELQHLATLGGDSDTNAAVAGSLFGAKHGIQYFEQNWIEAVMRFDENDFNCARVLALIGM